MHLRSIPMKVELMRFLRHRFYIILAATFAGLAASLATAADAPQRATENVILFMTDGLRWQEVFGGAEKILLDKENGGVEDVEALDEGVFGATRPKRGARC